MPDRHTTDPINCIRCGWEPPTSTKDFDQPNPLGGGYEVIPNSDRWLMYQAHLLEHIMTRLWERI